MFSYLFQFPDAPQLKATAGNQTNSLECSKNNEDTVPLIEAGTMERQKFESAQQPLQATPGIQNCSYYLQRGLKLHAIGSALIFYENWLCFSVASIGYSEDLKSSLQATAVIFSGESYKNSNNFVNTKKNKIISALVKSRSEKRPAHQFSRYCSFT